MKSPSILSVPEVEALIKGVSKNFDGRWVPCRPSGMPLVTWRVRAAWLVLTGRADALVWPEGQ